MSLLQKYSPRSGEGFQTGISMPGWRKPPFIPLPRGPYAARAARKKDCFAIFPGAEAPV
jgi:hypothetical protein